MGIDLGSLLCRAQASEHTVEVARADHSFWLRSGNLRIISKLAPTDSFSPAQLYDEGKAGRQARPSDRSWQQGGPAEALSGTISLEVRFTPAGTFMAPILSCFTRWEWCAGLFVEWLGRSIIGCCIWRGAFGSSPVEGRVDPVDPGCSLSIFSFCCRVFLSRFRYVFYLEAGQEMEEWGLLAPPPTVGHRNVLHRQAARPTNRPLNRTLPASCSIVGRYPLDASHATC